MPPNHLISASQRIEDFYTLYFKKSIDALVVGKATKVCRVKMCSRQLDVM